MLDFFVKSYQNSMFDFLYDLVLIVYEYFIIKILVIKVDENVEIETK